jgi:hypothetical protein
MTTRTRPPVPNGTPGPADLSDMFPAGRPVRGIPLARPPRRAVGDEVGLDGPKYHGRRFRIAKVNPTTYLLDALDGGRSVRASHSLVTDPPAAGTATTIPLTEYLDCGTLVRYVGVKTIAGIAPGDLGVVLVDRGGRVNVAKLGGAGGRYLRASHGSLRVVDPADVLRS